MQDSAINTTEASWCLYAQTPFYNCFAPLLLQPPRVSHLDAKSQGFSNMPSYAGAFDLLCMGPQEVTRPSVIRHKAGVDARGPR